MDSTGNAVDPSESGFGKIIMTDAYNLIQKSAASNEMINNQTK